jgi:hypothetical protein
MGDTGDNQSKPATEDPSQRGATDPPAITDIVFDRGMNDVGLSVVVGLAVGIGGVALIIWLMNVLPATGLAKSAAVVIAAIGVGSLLWTAALVLRNRAARKVRRKLAESTAPDLATRIEELLPTLRSMHPQKLIRETAKTLADQGTRGATVRIAPAAQATPIEPICVPFEPLRFEEIPIVDTRPQPASGAPPSTDADGGSERKAPPRGVRKNVLLKGGWALVVLYGIIWLAYAIESLMKLRPTPTLLIWTAVLVVFVLTPAGTHWITGRDWLALPGAIVTRKSGWFRRTWELHVFERSRSILLMYRLWQYQWVLVLADAEKCTSTIGTRDELESALRAWLSPLPPPALEQLSDLR